MEEQPLERNQKFEDLFQSLCDPNGSLMVIAHRGMWFHAPENSIRAIQEAINLDVDMIEIDVQRTRDGVLVLMHDETVDRMTEGSGRIDELNYEDIRRLHLRMSQGGEQQALTSLKVPTLEEVMLLVKNRMIVNLDKCWAFREDIYKLLERTDTIHHALFKSAAQLDEVEHFLASKPVRPEYMHIITIRNQALLHSLPDWLEQLRPRAVELIFKEEGLISSQETIHKLRGRCRVWLNAMLDSLCAGYTDEKSLHCLDDGWGWMLNRGANMIQTDYPEQLVQLRDQIMELR